MPHYPLAIEKDGEKVELPADTAISSIGYLPENGLAESLEDCSAKVETLGDCDYVSNLMDAIWKAFESAKEI